MANEDANDKIITDDHFTGFLYLLDANSQSPRQYAMEFVNGKAIPPLRVYNGEPLKTGETVYAISDEQEAGSAGAEVFIVADAYQITATAPDAKGSGYDIKLVDDVTYKIKPFIEGGVRRYAFEVIPESREALLAEGFTKFPFRYVSANPATALPPPGGKAGVARSEIEKLLAARNPKKAFNTPAAPYKPNPAWKISDTQLEQALQKYGRDLTAAARARDLDPVVGRDNEIDQALKILTRRIQSSLCFTGEAGTGKTAMFRGVAQRLVDDEASLPRSLQGATVVQLDLQSMNAGSQYRGQFEEKLKPITEGLAERKGKFKGKKLILAIDELPSQMTAGASEGGSNAGNLMKPMLTTEGVSAMGTTTKEEYRKHIEKDMALASRFEQTNIDPPDEEATLTILKKLWPMTKTHNSLTEDMSDDDFRYIVTMSNRYAPQQFQPRKSEKVMYTAASSAEFEHRTTISRDDIITAVAQMSGLDFNFLKQNDSQRFLALKEDLPKEVVGQPGIAKISRALIGARSGLNDPKQPWGCFVLQGPSGTGKTETCKALARHLFGDESALIQLNMSDYQQEHDVSKLTGAPPGYIGFDEPPLTEKIRQQPYCILLLDELEKAHPKVFDKFLSVLQDGKMTDNHNNTVLFNNVIIVMTTNLGASAVEKLVAGKSGMSYGNKSTQSPEKLQQDMEKIYEEARKQENRGPFRPEMINRINLLGGFITFRPLEKEAIALIAEREIKNINQRLGKNEGAGVTGASLAVSPAVMEQICTEGYNPSMGARPLQRVVREKLSNPLGEWILLHKEEIENFVKKEGSVKLVVSALEQDADGYPAVNPVLTKADPPDAINDNKPVKKAPARKKALATTAPKS